MAFKQEPQVIIEGTFSKKGRVPSASRWKQRYFVLYDNCILTYAESQNSPVIHQIDLKDVDFVQDDAKNTNYRILMKTSNQNKERIWHFAFQTQHLRELWKNELIRCTKYNSVTGFVERKQDIEEKKQFMYDLKINANKLKQNLEMKKRRHSLTVYQRCFVGAEAVKLLIEHNIASISNENEAVDFGNLLIKHKIIQHVENRREFINGLFYYYFVSHNGDDAVSDISILDLESAVNDSQNPRDIVNLIHRCETDMERNLTLNHKLDSLYETLCDKFASAENHCKYEAFLDKLGKIDALKHFMNRHKFLVLPLDAIMDQKYLNSYCQLIHYDEPHVIKYNTAYLSSTSTNCYKQTATCDLKHIHCMQGIELFAALPMPNGHPSLNSNSYYDIDGEQNQFLFRLLRNNECDTNNEWSAKYRFAYEEWTLCELEEYLGLFFYKTIHQFVSLKLKHNKIPIPWRKKIKHNKCTAESGDNKCDSTECIEMFDAIVSGHDPDFPPNLNMFNVLLMTWIIYRKHCSHIKHPDNVYQKQLKLMIFTKFIHKLCKQFFTAFHAKQHLVKYILTLHYFASDLFDGNDPICVHSQSHMFEMALNAIKYGTCLGWKDKRHVIDFLHAHHWAQCYVKKDTNIQLYLEKELKNVDTELNQIYKALTQKLNFECIESQIKIVSGNIIFRQDHPHVLSSNWFDAKQLIIKRMFIDDDNCGQYREPFIFEEKCAQIMFHIATYLAPRFNKWIKTLFSHHHHIRVFELNVKPMEIIHEELCLMTNKNIKFPKSASIRDYMRSFIVFPSIEHMLNGYRIINNCSKANSAMFRLVHMDNGISKQHKRIVDNFHIINIHAVFSQKHPQYGKLSLIGEICFCLESVWKTYGMKKYIIDSYALLLTPQRAYEIAKSLSVSKEHPDYDCRVKQLADIQNKYLREDLSL